MPLNLIDPKIHRHWRRYSAHMSLGAALIAATIASTVFVLFISPESESAQPIHALGGHTLAIIVGSALALVVDTGVGTEWITAAPVIFSVYAALGVGLTMFLMAATNTEHPPAAGTALAIVAHGFAWGSGGVRRAGRADRSGGSPGAPR